jgi:4-hydroxy-4-methyl-2-oxoglutarate aldolase
MIHIKKKIPTCDPALVSALAEQSSATLHEAMGRIGAIDMSVKPIARGMKLCGRAITVSCHTADNIMLIKAVSMIARAIFLWSTQARLFQRPVRRGARSRMPG